MTVSFPGGKRVDASFNGFDFATDQAVDSGGEGSAPEPFDYFLASLGTCAGIYVLGFCQKRNIPYDGISLSQSWDREEKTNRLTNVRISIEVPEDFPEKYRDLENPPEFVVETVTVWLRN
jgi:ribosomal protein S12 methylthiotransferase accessory factor